MNLREAGTIRMLTRWLGRIATAGGAVLLAGALCWAAYRQGLFYDRDMYRLETIWLAAATLAAACLAVAGRRLPLWALAPFGLAAAYALAWADGPASVHGTADSVLRWCLYGAWLVLAALLMLQRSGRAAGHIALHVGGLFFTGGALAGWYGWLRYPDIVYRSSDAALSMTGARLAGFLQYPNTCGAVLAFFALALWQLLDRPGRSVRSFARLALVPTLTALLLTESRGAWLALAVAGALALAAAPRRGRRGYGLAAAGLAAFGASFAAHVAFRAMETGAPAQGAWALAVATAAFAVAAALLRPPESVAAATTRRRGHGGRGSRDERGTRGAPAARIRRLLTGAWGGAAVFAVCAALSYLLLASGGAAGHSRAEGNLETAGARTLYYRDALHMFADRPLLGAGGETWRMQVGLYQSGPYIGNEVHSGYLEILIDTGAVGAAALLVMLAVFARRLARVSARGVWGPAAVLLMHAAVDFDWSYGYVWLLLLSWLALHLTLPSPPPSPARPLAPEQPRRRLAWARFARLALPPLLLLGAAAAATPLAVGSAQAEAAYKAAQGARGDAARLELLREAQRASPSWNRPRLEAAALLPAAERPAWLAQGLRYEPASPGVRYALGMAYADRGDVLGAAAQLQEALRLARFDRDSQNAVIARFAQLARQLADEGDSAGARLAGAAGIGFFERYRDLYAQQYAGRSNPWYGTALFVSAKVNAAKCALLAGRGAEAEPWLREAIQDGDEDWRQEAAVLLEQLS